MLLASSQSEVLAAGSNSALLIEIGGLVLLLAVLGRIANRLSLPTVPLFLLIGVVVGGSDALSLEESQSFLDASAQIGAVLLLFMLGLEYTPSELTDNVRSNWAAGLVDLLLNFSVGYVVALVLGYGQVAAVLLGGVTYITSSGIVSKLLDDLDRLGNRETPTILSILVIEDLVMLIYLPIAGAMVLDVGFGSAAITVSAILVGVVVVLLIARRFERHLNDAVHTQSSELLLFTLLGASLLFAGLAEKAQVSASVAAFIVGVMVSGQVADRARDLLRPLRDLFGAMFFLVFGLRLETSELVGALGVALVLAGISTVTKLATGWWAAGRSGSGPRGRRRAAVTLVPRGEFSIVIAGLAVAAGVGEVVGPIAAAYVLIVGITGSVAAALTR